MFPQQSPALSALLDTHRVLMLESAEVPAEVQRYHGACRSAHVSPCGPLCEQTSGAHQHCGWEDLTERRTGRVECIQSSWSRSNSFHQPGNEATTQHLLPEAQGAHTTDPVQDQLLHQDGASHTGTGPHQRLDLYCTAEQGCCQ